MTQRISLRRTVLYIFTFFLVLTGLNEHLRAAGITVQSSVDTTIATIGDPVKLHIQAAFPADVQILFPELDGKLGEFEILNLKTGKKQKTGENSFFSDWSLTLAAFDTGLTEIPSIQIKARYAGDSLNVLSFNTDPAWVNVISVLPPDAAEIRDIKPPFDLRLIIPWDIVIFILILAAIIGGWIWQQWRWKKSHPVVPFKETYLEPPHVIAIKKLNKIRDWEADTPDLKKAYYSELSEILREYVERRFFIRALEMSTSEILDAFKKKESASENVLILADIFNRFDMVKFAKQVPEKSDIPAAWDQVYQFVDKTRHDNFLAAKSIL